LAQPTFEYPPHAGSVSYIPTGQPQGSHTASLVKPQGAFKYLAGFVNVLQSVHGEHFLSAVDEHPALSYWKRGQLPMEQGSHTASLVPPQGTFAYFEGLVNVVQSVHGSHTALLVTPQETFVYFAGVDVAQFVHGRQDESR